MATTFPFTSTPSIGDKVTLTGGSIVAWSGSAWVLYGVGGGATVTVSETPPTSPSLGAFWYQDSTASLSLCVGTTGPTWLQVNGISSGGATFAGKTLNYTGGLLTEELLYADSAKTVLLLQKHLSYSNGLLTSVVTLNASGAVLSTRTLTYASGALTSITES
jgi:hypothetical protein